MNQQPLKELDASYPISIYRALLGVACVPVAPHVSRTSTFTREFTVDPKGSVASTEHSTGTFTVPGCVIEYIILLIVVVQASYLNFDSYELSSVKEPVSVPLLTSH